MIFLKICVNLLETFFFFEHGQLKFLQSLLSVLFVQIPPDFPPKKVAYPRCEIRLVIYNLSRNFQEIVHINGQICLSIIIYWYNLTELLWFFCFPKQVSEFDWGPELRGAILSSFFYGYISTQLIGGLLGAKIGGVKLIGYGVLCTAILTILTPVAARYSVYLVIFLRVVEGVFEVRIYY